MNSPILSLWLTTALTVSCAHDIKKAEVPAAANPAEEISRLEQEINASYAEQIDVLAEDSFSQARSYLDEAKSDLSSGQKSSEVLDDIAYAQAYLTRAKELAAGRRTSLVEPILEARNAALASDAKNVPALRERFKDLDDEMRKASKDFGRRLDQDDITRLQGSYLAIELAGIQNRELGKAKAAVAGARRDGARRNTPRTLAHAELSISTAEQVIAANRHNSAGYTESVDKANSAAQLLTEVLSTSKRPGPDIDEAAALKMVAQNRRIASLEGQLGTAEASVTEMSENLRKQNQKLKGAASAINIREAFKQAQEEFDRDEAEVYLEGDNRILIRLKAMNFPSGKADLPPESITLLAKVKDVASNLGPGNVIVEGHTDSTGKSATNQALSQQRAEAVAKYLEENGLGADRIDAVGQGYKKPIASNKSKTGRAQNRRVDVIITPSQSN